MSTKRHRDEYEKLYVTFSKRVERFLVRSIALALALLLAAQASMQIPAVRHWLTRVDSLEGVPYRHGAEHPGAPASAVPSSQPQRK